MDNEDYIPMDSPTMDQWDEYSQAMSIAEAEGANWDHLSTSDKVAYLSTASYDTEDFDDV